MWRLAGLLPALWACAGRGAGADAAPEGAADVAATPSDATVAQEPEVAAERAPARDAPPADGAVDFGKPLDFMHPGGLAVGYYHSCIIEPSLEVKCFPVSPDMCQNSGGTPYDGGPGKLDRNCPPPGLKAVQIAATHTHDCAILPPGQTPRLDCWGATWVSHATALARNRALDPVQVVVGDDHSCALNRDGSVVCAGEAAAMSTPPAGLRAKFLAACGVFTCAIRPDDGVVCWGLHPPALPADLEALHIAVENDGANHQGQAELSTISRHACAVRLDHTVTCWGDNGYHQLDVPVGILAKQVAVGTTHSCALLLDGQVRCWGRVSSPAGLRAKSIAANHFAACAIKEDDTVTCWAARFGQEQANGAKVLAPGE